MHRHTPGSTWAGNALILGRSLLNLQQVSQGKMKETGAPWDHTCSVISKKWCNFEKELPDDKSRKNDEHCLCRSVVSDSRCVHVTPVSDTYNCCRWLCKHFICRCLILALVYSCYFGEFGASWCFFYQMLLSKTVIAGFFFVYHYANMTLHRVSSWQHPTCFSPLHPLLFGFVCLIICLFVCLFVWSYAYMFVCLIICLYICLIICLNFCCCCCLYAYLFVYLIICEFVCLFGYMLICLFVCLITCELVCLIMSLFVWLVGYMLICLFVSLFDYILSCLFLCLIIWLYLFVWLYAYLFVWLYAYLFVWLFVYLFD